MFLLVAFGSLVLGLLIWCEKLNMLINSMSVILVTLNLSKLDLVTLKVLSNLLMCVEKGIKLEKRKYGDN